MVKSTVSTPDLAQRAAESARKREAREVRNKAAQDEAARKTASEVVADPVVVPGSSTNVVDLVFPCLGKFLPVPKVLLRFLFRLSGSASASGSGGSVLPYRDADTGGIEDNPAELEPSGPVEVRGLDAVAEALMAPPSSSVFPLPSPATLLESIPKEPPWKLLNITWIEKIEGQAVP